MDTEYDAASRLKEVLEFHDQCQGAGGEAACRQKLAANPKDLEARLGLASCLASEGNIPKLWKSSWRLSPRTNAFATKRPESRCWRSSAWWENERTGRRVPSTPGKNFVLNRRENQPQTQPTSPPPFSSKSSTPHRSLASLKAVPYVPVRSPSVFHWPSLLPK